MKTRTLAIALFAAVSTGSAANAADTVVAKFLPRIGASLQYGSFGYTNDEGEYEVLTDHQIIKTRIVIDFIPGPGVDPLAFFAGMVVPTDGPSQFLTVEGSKLTAAGDGSYHYEASSDDYNGTIYAGRFSIDCYGIDVTTGEPTSLSGSSFGPESGFFFTVAVPEPTTLSTLAGGSLLLARRRR
jgi:hypothetical protein